MSLKEKLAQKLVQLSTLSDKDHRKRFQKYENLDKYTLEELVVLVSLLLEEKNVG